MADRILTWYVETPDSAETAFGPKYTLDDQYVLRRVTVSAKTAGSGGAWVYDINVDGTSVFPTTKPGLPATAVAEDTDVFGTDVLILQKDSIVSLDIDSVPSGPPSGVTISLELDKDD